MFVVMCDYMQRLFTTQSCIRRKFITYTMVQIIQVRVAFTQRRARLHDAAIYNNNNYNNNSTTEFSILGNGLMGTSITTTNNTNTTNGSGSGESGSSGASYKVNRGSGTEYFKLEAFGISGLEVSYCMYVVCA